MDGQTDRLMDRHKLMDRQTDEEMDGQTDRWTGSDRQMDRQRN